MKIHDTIQFIEQAFFASTHVLRLVAMLQLSAPVFHVEMLFVWVFVFLS